MLSVWAVCVKILMVFVEIKISRPKKPWGALITEKLKHYSTFLNQQQKTAGKNSYKPSCCEGSNQMSSVWFEFEFKMLHCDVTTCIVVIFVELF